MKKKLLFAVVSCVAFFACSENEVANSQCQDKHLTVEDMSYVGEFHNKAMSNIAQGLETLEENIRNNEENAPQIIIDFFDEKMAQAQPDEMKEMHSCKKFMKFLDTNELSQCFGKKSETRTGMMALSVISTVNAFASADSLDFTILPSLDAIIDAYTETNILSSQKAFYFNNLISLTRRNKQGLLSDEQFELGIESLINHFDAEGFVYGDTIAMYIASVLSVASSSIEWWQENPEGLPTQGKVAPAVAADLAGAVITALVDVVATGSSNWASVGINAAISSAGIIPKVTTFIQRGIEKVSKAVVVVGDWLSSFF